MISSAYMNFIQLLFSFMEKKTIFILFMIPLHTNIYFYVYLVNFFTLGRISRPFIIKVFLIVIHVFILIVKIITLNINLLFLLIQILFIT